MVATGFNSNLFGISYPFIYASGDFHCFCDTSAVFTFRVCFSKELFPDMQFNTFFCLHC